MIIFNDASLHGQFAAFEPFLDSLRDLLDIRKKLQEKGLSLKVCRSIRNQKVTASQTFNDFIGSITNQDLKRYLLVWLDREGPFWEDQRQHDASEYFECCGEVVTDTGLAEAAYLNINEDTSSLLISLNPSSFETNPLTVFWKERNDEDIEIKINNACCAATADELASHFETAPESWPELIEWAKRICPNLLLSEDIINQLGTQFIPNVARRTQVLLNALNSIIQTQKDGNHSKFNELRRKWMEGGNARFTSSSDSELDDFAGKLTFKHPVSEQSITCSWHGKIKTPQYRIHIEWPMPKNSERLFVAYIGPKITKR